MASPTSAFGIARAVEPLVVLEDDMGHGPGESDVLDHLVADPGMVLDELEFRLRQAAGLGHDLGGGGDLADVVDDAGEAEAFDLVPRQVHVLGDGHGQAGDPLLVPGHVGVPELEGHGHGPERAFEGPLQPVEGALKVVLGTARLQDLAVELVVGPGELRGPLVDELVDLDPGQPQLLFDADALGGVLLHAGRPAWRRPPRGTGCGSPDPGPSSPGCRPWR